MKILNQLIIKIYLNIIYFVNLQLFLIQNAAMQSMTVTQVFFNLLEKVLPIKFVQKENVRGIKFKKSQVYLTISKCILHVWLYNKENSHIKGINKVIFHFLKNRVQLQYVEIKQKFY